MKRIMKWAAISAALVAPGALWAGDSALIVVEDDYRTLPDAGGASEAADLARRLEAQGFEVTSVLDSAAEDTWAKVLQFRTEAARADRVLVLLAGHFASTARDSYLLARQADRPTDLSIGAEALAVGPILDLLAEHQGQAVLMLAPSRREITGAGVVPGVTVTAPQGVTMMSGPLDDLVALASDTLLQPGLPLGLLVDDAPRGVSVSGFLSDAVPFTPAPGGAVTLPAPAPQVSADDNWWEVVRQMGTVAAYQAYLDEFPRGAHRDAARAGIAGIADNATARAEATEATLGLDREGRKSVQRNLALLGFDPKGIDGLFGPGSRAAIGAWQRANAYEATGYLTGEQLRRLGDAAAARAAQLEAEAAARKAEQDRLDRAYWSDTGQGNDEAGLRAYLKRYPDGLFADVARERLDAIEAGKRADAAAEERAYWDRVRGEDTLDGYSAYVARYPNGSFVDAAQARIAELQAADNRRGQDAKAEQEERRVAGEQVTRFLVETRLKLLGFDPGRVDGQFDDQARRAIRQFQRAQGVDVSGYVTQDTMVRLLAAR